MRTLLSIKDILEESNRIENCPRCEGEEALFLANINVEFTKKGKVFVHKHGVCETHGIVKVVRRVKSVLMLGDDVQVVPRAEGVASVRKK